MYSVDWAVRKKFQIYNVEKDELTNISPTRDAFDKFFSNLSDKGSFYIEEGGGDTFKLLALKHKHQVFTISGKKVKEHREKLGLLENDENSAKVIGILVIEQPQEFYEYQELDATHLKIAICYKEYCKIVKDSTCKKNQLYALENRLELLTSKKEVKKIISARKETIKALNKEVSSMNSQLLRLVKKSPLWINYLKDIKGVGPVTAAGIIGSVRRFSRFPNKYSIRHFAGMITKKDNSSYNRYLKSALYNFIEGIIKRRTQPWRELYDKMKVYYKEKHLDWKPGKVNAYAKKAVQTKFLDWVWNKGVQIEN